MPRFAITAIVISSHPYIDLACRKLRNELRKPRNRRFLELEDLEVVEIKE